MPALIKTLFISSLLGIFLLIGCDDTTGSSPSNPVTGKYKGTVSDSAFILDFKDTSFTGEFHSQFGTFLMTGTYKYAASTITLKYGSGVQDGIGIPPPSPDSVNGGRTATQILIPVPYNYTGADSLVTLTKQ